MTDLKIYPHQRKLSKNEIRIQNVFLDTDLSNLQIHKPQIKKLFGTPDQILTNLNIKIKKYSLQHSFTCAGALLMIIFKENRFQRPC